jgi:hypothetical protein
MYIYIKTYIYIAQVFQVQKETQYRSKRDLLLLVYLSSE